jgi:hypothetical protein
MVFMAFFNCEITTNNLYHQTISLSQIGKIPGRLGIYILRHWIIRITFAPETNKKRVSTTENNKTKNSNNLKITTMKKFTMILMTAIMIMGASTANAQRYGHGPTDRHYVGAPARGHHPGGPRGHMAPPPAHHRHMAPAPVHHRRPLPPPVHHRPVVGTVVYGIPAGYSAPFYYHGRRCVSLGDIIYEILTGYPSPRYRVIGYL